MRLLLVLAVLSATAGWALTRAWETITGRYLPVPWTSVVGMALLAFALLVWTLMARPRLLRHDGAKPMDPLVAARTAALAMAASRTGAVLGGLYLGIGAAFLPLVDQDPGRERVVVAALTVVASVAVVVVALWLERCCRLPDPPEGQRREDDPGVLHG